MWPQPHQTDPAQAADLDQAAPVGTHGITVNPSGGDFGATAVCIPSCVTWNTSRWRSAPCSLRPVFMSFGGRRDARLAVNWQEDFYDSWGDSARWDRTAVSEWCQTVRNLIC